MHQDDIIFVPPRFSARVRLDVHSEYGPEIVDIILDENAEEGADLCADRNTAHESGRDTTPDRCTTTPMGSPRKRRPHDDANGVGARDKIRRLEGIASLVARSGAATEREILLFLLSESDEEDEGVAAIPQTEDESGSEDDEEEDEDDDQELRTLYKYMNPDEYGYVDLAHPLCSPVENVFGKSSCFNQDELELGGDN